MKNKPFKSIEEQVALLERRGVVTDADTPHILLSEGYYSVVNGYKTPFLDKDASWQAADDRYLPGTTFDDIYSTFCFDRDLRELTFHYLLKVEALIRTVCIYTFSEAYQDNDSYLNRDNFATEQEYRDLRLVGYADNMDKLQKVFIAAREHPRNEAVEYYLKEYEMVPLWVLGCTLTFGNIEHFFNLMKRSEQTKICKRVQELAGPSSLQKKRLAPIKARRAIDILVKYRNICAHDERLYCAKVDRRNPVDYFGLVDYISKFVSFAEATELIKKIATLVESYQDRNKALAHLILNMGYLEYADKMLKLLQRG